jgi:hypothetical protein
MNMDDSAEAGHAKSDPCGCPVCTRRTGPNGISNSPEPRGRPWIADAAAVLEQLRQFQEWKAAERGASAFYLSPATAARLHEAEAAGPEIDPVPQRAPIFGLSVFVIEAPNERRMEAMLRAFKGEEVLFEDDAGDFVLVSPRRPSGT